MPHQLTLDWVLSLLLGTLSWAFSGTGQCCKLWVENFNFKPYSTHNTEVWNWIVDEVDIWTAEVYQTAGRIVYCGQVCTGCLLSICWPSYKLKNLLNITIDIRKQDVLSSAEKLCITEYRDLHEVPQSNARLLYNEVYVETFLHLATISSRWSCPHTPVALWRTELVAIHPDETLSPNIH